VSTIGKQQTTVKLLSHSPGMNFNEMMSNTLWNHLIKQLLSFSSRFHKIEISPFPTLNKAII